MFKIAILGHGVVGGGTLQLINEKKSQLAKVCGEEIEVKYVLGRRKDVKLEYPAKYTTDFEDIINDNQLVLVVEAMGGKHPAYEYVKKSLQHGLHVVTSNKELVAAYGKELMETALENNVNFMFEASCGGAIPVIHPLRSCLAANEINQIAGILNGTTNYILTKMKDEGLSFDIALSQAQQLGYAEADPSADVDGLDTSRKICILSSIAYGHHIYPDYVFTKGIRDIRAQDVKILEKAGGVIKLLGMSQKTADGKIFIITAPFAILSDGVLKGTNDVFNAVHINTDAAGALGFFGRGAGSLPTASAVISDITECLCCSDTLYMPWGEFSQELLADYKEIPLKFYVNIQGQVQPLKNAQLLEQQEDTAFITETTTLLELEQTLKENGYYEKVNSILRVFQ